PRVDGEAQEAARARVRAAPAASAFRSVPRPRRLRLPCPGARALLERAAQPARVRRPTLARGFPAALRRIVVPFRPALAVARHVRLGLRYFPDGLVLA